MQRKLTKRESGYITPPREVWAPKNKGIRCGTCKFYYNHRCSLVKGDIHTQDCCNLWRSSKSKGFPSIDFACGKDIEDLLQ